VSLTALIELCKLIHAQSATMAGDRRDCAKSPEGGQDAQPRESGGAAAQTSLRRRGGLDDAARGGAGTLPLPLERNAGERSERTRKEAG